jgi:hypothetical protein
MLVSASTSAVETTCFYEAAFAPDQNWRDGYLVFFRSVFSILRSAFRCAFAYFFLAFSSFFSARRESRLCDLALPRACAGVENKLPAITMLRKITALSLFITMLNDN